MKEGCSSDIRNWRADLLAGVYYVHPESVHCISANIVTIDTGDEHLTFVVVHKQSPNHLWLSHDCIKKKISDYSVNKHQLS